MHEPTAETEMQNDLMVYDPATRETRPYPSHAEQWRKWHGPLTAWLYNPWTGNLRTATDVGSDPHGLLIVPPDLIMPTVALHDARCA